MITKETFLKKKEDMEKMLKAEEETADVVAMNVFTIKVALQWVDSELAKYPKEDPKTEKKKGFFSKK